MVEFSKPQRGQTRSEASSQARTPALRAARPPKMAKVTRPEPTVSWRATVNRTLPTAEATRATATAVRVERTAAGFLPRRSHGPYPLVRIRVGWWQDPDAQVGWGWWSCWLPLMA